MVLIGERLKEERDRLGLTQEQMAGRLKVTQKTQGLYERGQRMPNAEYLALMAAQGCDVLYVLTGQRTPTAQSLTVRETCMLENYRVLAEEDKAAMQRMTSALAQSAKPNDESA